MTTHTELFRGLSEPFPPDQVRSKPAGGGRKVSYITARHVMNRLDEVAGPENWWDEYLPFENSVLCKLSIRLPDGTVLTKCDAGGFAGMADQGDDDKSGYSDSLKRAAVKFGVGRELYGDGIAQFPIPEAAAPSRPTPPDLAGVVALDEALGRFSDGANTRWLESVEVDGELPEGVRDILGPPERRKLIGRLLTFGLRTGRIADDVPHDPKTGKPLGTIPGARVRTLVADLFARQPEAVMQECEVFARELADAKKAEWATAAVAGGETTWDEPADAGERG